MHFESEAQLVEHLREKIGSALPGMSEATTVETFVETPVGSLVPDLTLLCRESTYLPPSVKPFSAFESVLVATLRSSGSTRIDLLERKMQRSVGALRRGALAALETSGVLSRGTGGRVALSATWPPKLRLVAVEAKLRRWREALVQAESYRTFADRVFVALPQRYAEIALQHRSQFTKSGVGLISVSSEGVAVYYEGTDKEGHDWKRDFLVSRLLSGH